MGVGIYGLTKRFGPVAAVRGVNLTVEQGELMAIVGPSGCGKTTLLRMIAGLETPDEGSVHIQGEDVTTLAPERRSVGIVFQNYALFPHMNVAENVAYGLRRQKVPRIEARQRVNELLKLMGILDLKDRKPGQLSAGQQQGAALARSLAPRPATLLLDEPMSALDAGLRERLRDEIRRMQRLLGITTILVTHDQEEALAMADRIAVMRNGAIEQVGDPWSLYDEPQTEFVARFIGRGNFFAGKVDGRGVDLGPAGRAPLPAREGLRDGAVLGVVRPEALVLDEAGEGPGTDGGLRFQTVIRDVVFSGERCTLHLDWKQQSLIASLPGDRYRELQLRVGKACAVSIPFKSLRWVRRDP